MNRPLILIGSLVAALAVSACNANGGSSNVPTTAGIASGGTNVKLWGPNVRAVCPDTPGRPQCLALLRTDIPVQAAQHPETTPAGLSPADFQAAYDLPSSTNGKGTIVAIVDMDDNPNVASDLAVYRSQFGLGTANFTKYNQDGQQSNYPSPNANWGLEEDLDVEMVSASCPNCTIYLIETNGDMQQGEEEAVKLGAHIISNSWICYGSNSCVTGFDTKGVTYLASSGDKGYDQIGAPMALGSVIAVGGTNLSKDTQQKRGWEEIAWPGAGSGCATGVTKPSWQHDPKCTSRMTADIAADACPCTGPAEYDSYDYGGWFVIGGTSVASPLTAGIVALAGNEKTLHAAEKFWTKRFEKPRHLNHITSGSNGSCTPKYFCTDGTHEYRDYGGPTGWGTAHGISAY